MIPKKLTLSGLYSYAGDQEQVVDFEKLSSTGLFGIFGAVGSGKSSILDAMLLALYGQVDRLGKSGRNYNILNLNSNELCIEFIFESRDDKGKDQRYKSVFALRRNSKNEEDVKTNPSKTGFYRWDEGVYTPLEYKPEEVIGITYEDFLKTVVIPQGKFKEFIDQGSKDKTSLLQKIFKLDRYDYSDAIKKLAEENNLKLSHVEGSLEQLQSFTEEGLDTLQKNQKQKEEEYAEFEIKYEPLKSQLKELDRIADLFQQKRKLTSEKEKIQIQAKEIEQIREQVNRYQHAKSDFSDLLRQTQKEKLLIKNLQIEIDQLSEEVIKLEEHKDVKTKDYQRLSADYAQLEDWKEKLRDLEIVAECKHHLEEVSKLEAAILKSKQDLKLLAEEKNKIQNSFNSLKQEIEGAEDLSSERIMLEKLKLLRESEADFSNRRNQHEDKIVKQKSEINNLLPEAIASDWSWSTYHADAKAKINAKELELNLIQDQLLAVKHEEKLMEYAQNLQEGDPCPVCGSEHHPTPLKEKNLHQQEAELAEKKQLLKEDIELLQEAYNDGKVKEQSYLRLQKDIEEQEDSLKELNERLQKKRDELKSFTEDQLKLTADQINDSMHEIEEKQSALQIKKNKFNQLEVLLKRKEERTKQLEIDIRTKETQCKAEDQNYGSKRAKIKILHAEFDKYLQKSVASLLENAAKGKAKIEATERGYEKLREELEYLGQTLIGTRSKMAGKVDERAQREDELRSLNSVLDDRLNQSIIFTSLDEVTECLNQELDLVKLTKQVSSYEEHKNRIDNQLEPLMEALKGISYDNVKHDQLKEEIIVIEQQLKQWDQELAVIKDQIKDWQEKLMRKQSLEKDNASLIHRKDHLNLMRRLFTGKAFIAYISDFYLRALVEKANVRFQKMSKGTLSIEVNENREFTVRDHINGGKVRLLKTLSGGQTFQASLCLALALSDSFRMGDSSGKSFFFLDEGFGSLDKESIELVFETLRSLKNENRIVGIISHVEELQQQISPSLRVTHEGSRGSIISADWELMK
ncbi:MAG: SMC family ATPase [Cyclobacteriaceae bacterium]|nr:SMC family ATPase [Cyclobacteriaceae bacterium]MCH8517370.1 SMC family ATPase [Cyclobacteriaceae bacterium]